MQTLADRLIFTPDDVDLTRSPLRASLCAETYVLGAFNPGLTRLPNGNLLMMVRVAEALREPVFDGEVHMIAWTPEGYRLEGLPVATVNVTDPRQFGFLKNGVLTLGLTSLSWLLPVELTPDGLEVVAAHYDKAIAPTASYQMYGIEDARISIVEGRWYMTACAVSPERHCTVLYTSDNGLDYTLEGIVLDHQNKDMLVFEGKVGGKFMALTRPMGSLYLAYPQDSPYESGPSILLAQSPDALHWKPLDRPGIRARKVSKSSAKVGGGTPPIRTDAGWLMLYHGVEPVGVVGVYRTFWAILDADDPTRILCLEDQHAVLNAEPTLTAHIQHQAYLDTPVVFTTGIADGGDHYVVASGEGDLACRITHLAKTLFA